MYRRSDNRSYGLGDGDGVNIAEYASMDGAVGEGTLGTETEIAEEERRASIGVDTVLTPY